MSNLLEYQVDDYNCVQIIDERLLQHSLDSKWFDNILAKSLQHFTDKKYKAIWLQLRSPSALNVIPFIGKYSFYPHHCQPHYIMFVKWMDPSRPNLLPPPAQHAIGVGAVLINSKKQLLMVQETTGPASKFKIWKLPGGLVDSGEIISDAVVRELKEETGVDARFKSWCCCIEMMNKYRPPRNGGKTVNSFYVRNPARGGGVSDIYCMCLCEIVGDEDDVKLVKQKNEIADLRWFDLEDVFKMPLWKINGKGESTGVWSDGLKTCVDIYEGRLKGFSHQILPFAFKRGKGSIYHAKL